MIFPYCISATSVKDIGHIGLKKMDVVSCSARFDIRFNHCTCIVIQTVSRCPTYASERETDINIDITTERLSGQSKRQRRGGHGRPRQCMTPTPPPLSALGKRQKERERDWVARRSGPMQTQHHLLQ